MKTVSAILALVLGGIGGMVLLLIPWFFFGMANWSVRFGLPPLTLPWALAGAVAIGAVAGLAKELGRQRQVAQRTRANRELAARLRLEFDEPPKPLEWPTALQRAVHEGVFHAAAQRLRGNFAGLPLDVVDIAYFVRTEGAEGGGATHKGEHTVVAWQVPGKSLPHLAISPRGWMADLGLALGGADWCVTFDAAGPDAEIIREFNRRFIVTSKPDSPSQATAVRRVCSPAVMEALLGLGSCRVAIVNGWLAVWRPATVLSGAERERLIRTSSGLIKVVLGSAGDRQSAIVPADPRAVTKAQWKMLPAGCALASATPAFFLGGILGFALIVTKTATEFPVVLPVVAFGTMFLGAATGWWCGKGLQRWFEKP